MSRGVPIKKAMDENNLIVWAMNGEPLPNIHGGPVRLIIPGWPGSVSAKWLTRIWVRDKVHDGPGMGGTSYRVAIKPMVPGGKPDESNFRDLESMPVRSIITSPANGTKLASNVREVKLRGAAWAGDLAVRRVDVSVDFGATWRPAQLAGGRRTATTGSAGPRPCGCRARAITRSGRGRPTSAASCSRTSPATGIRRATARNPMHRIAVLVG